MHPLAAVWMGCMLIGWVSAYARILQYRPIIYAFLKYNAPFDWITADILLKSWNCNRSLWLPIMASSIAAISITLGFSRYGQQAITYYLRLYSNPAKTSECHEGTGTAVWSARNTPRDYRQMSFSSSAWSWNQNRNGQRAQLSGFEFLPKEHMRCWQCWWAGTVKYII